MFERGFFIVVGYRPEVYITLEVNYSLFGDYLLGVFGLWICEGIYQGCVWISDLVNEKEMEMKKLNDLTILSPNL